MVVDRRRDYDPSPAYTRRRKNIINNVNSMLSEIEREQWHLVIRLANGIVDESVELLMMKDEA